MKKWIYTGNEFKTLPKHYYLEYAVSEAFNTLKFCINTIFIRAISNQVIHYEYFLLIF